MTAQEKDQFAADQPEVKAMATLDELNAKRAEFNAKIIAMADEFRRATGMEVSSVFIYYNHKDTTRPIEASSVVVLPQEH